MNVLSSDDFGTFGRENGLYAVWSILASGRPSDASPIEQGALIRYNYFGEDRQKALEGNTLGDVYKTCNDLIVNGDPDPGWIDHRYIEWFHALPDGSYRLETGS